jgi:hypothetical protein
MKTLVTGVFGVVLGMLLYVSLATAGQVYGTVKEGNGPARNKIVEVFCPDKDPLPPRTAKTNTDEFGSYSIYVDYVGICAFKVDGKKKVSAPLYDDEVRYDFRIVGNRLESD